MTGASITTGAVPLAELGPVLRTRRLVLRLPHPRDEPAFVRFWTSDRSRQNDGPLSEERARRAPLIEAMVWYLQGIGLWVGDDAQTGRATVCVALKPDVDAPATAELGWYVLDPACEGWGFAHEAAEAVIAYGRDRLGITGFRANMEADNRRSRRLAERLGARLMRRYDRNGRPCVGYGIGEVAA